MSETDAKPTSSNEPKTALYASAENPVVLRPHVYDGIQEYDQRLPNWWLFTFYIMIVYFVIFWIAFYQLDYFKGDHERIEATMAAVQEKKEAELEKLLVSLDDRSLVTEWAHNEIALANGQETFNSLCTACHAADLSATISGVALPGLPLTDGEWKYGEKPIEIFDLIRKGTPPDSEGHNGAKMEAWSNRISSKTIAELTAFIISKNEAEFAKYAQ